MATWIIVGVCGTLILVGTAVLAVKIYRWYKRHQPTTVSDLPRGVFGPDRPAEDTADPSRPPKPPRRLPPIPYGATSSTLRRGMPPTYPQTLPGALPPISPHPQSSRPVTSMTTITVA